MITNFFKRVNKEDSDKETIPNKARTNIEDCVNGSSNKQEAVNAQVLPNDVATFCNRMLSDKEKYDLIVNVWKPDQCFHFPKSGERNLRFKLNWLQNFTWLAYSPSEDGAYCRYCVHFASNNVVFGNSQVPNAFVRLCFRNWKKTIDKCKDHQSKQYHGHAVEAAANFKLIYEKKVSDVASQVDEGRKKRQLENRQKLFPIVQAILLCGRQGIALRGNNDDGPLSLEMPLENDGNFKSLLRFAIQNGNKILENHIQYGAGNAQYISHIIQNDIIELAGNILTSKLVARINESKCFTVLADETTDVSGIEQFSIGVRYVYRDSKGFCLREDFLRFVPVEDVTGKGLADTLGTSLRNMGIDLQYLRGQGYDGARSMSGVHKGCATIIKGMYPYALYIHCANHCLNLSLVHACNVLSIRNCISSVKDVVNLFRKSNKAAHILKDAITSDFPDAKRTRLLKFCETRWVEHITSLSLFYEVYKHVCFSLEELNSTSYRSDGEKAGSLLHAIKNPSFIIAITVIKPIFLLIKNLSLSLQNKKCDLSECVSYASDLIDELQSMRSNSIPRFKEIFKEAQLIAEQVEIELKPHKRIALKEYRENHEDDPEAFFRCTVYIPFLDHLIAEINARFLEHRNLFGHIQTILPSKSADLQDDDIIEALTFFLNQWPTDVNIACDEFFAEFKMWSKCCAQIAKDDRPNTFVDALSNCDAQFFPTINRLLRIGATLPVSIASSERSFSSLRRIKNYLRNKTGEKRLNGLALLNVHRDVEITPEEIINAMSQSSRKLPMSI